MNCAFLLAGINGGHIPKGTAVPCLRQLLDRALAEGCYGQVLRDVLAAQVPLLASCRACGADTFLSTDALTRHKTALLVAIIDAMDAELKALGEQTGADDNAPHEAYGQPVVPVLVPGPAAAFKPTVKFEQRVQHGAAEPSQVDVHGRHPVLVRACNHAFERACADGSRAGAALLLEVGFGRQVLPRALSSALCGGHVAVAEFLLGQAALSPGSAKNIATTGMLSGVCKSAIRMDSIGTITAVLDERTREQVGRRRKRARGMASQVAPGQRAWRIGYEVGAAAAAGMLDYDFELEESSSGDDSSVSSRGGISVSSLDSDDSSVNSELMGADLMRSIPRSHHSEYQSLPGDRFMKDGPDRKVNDCVTIVLQYFSATSAAWHGLEADLVLAASAAGLTTIVQGALGRAHASMRKRVYQELLRAALRVACHVGTLPVVQVLLAAGARPWWRRALTRAVEDDGFDAPEDEDDRDPLVLAAAAGHVRLVQALLQHFGERIDPRTVRQAFDAACAEGRSETVHFLLTLPRVATGITATRAAEVIIDTTLAARFDPFPSKFGPAVGSVIPLLLARLMGPSHGRISAGLPSGSSPDATRLPSKLISDGPGLLHDWADFGRTDVVTALVDAGVPIVDSRARQALLAAHVEVVSDDPNAGRPRTVLEDELGRCALGPAVERHHAGVLHALLQTRAGHEPLPPPLLVAALKRAVSTGCKQTVLHLCSAEGIGKEAARTAAARFGLQEVVEALGVQGTSQTTGTSTT